MTDSELNGGLCVCVSYSCSPETVLIAEGPPSYPGVTVSETRIN